MTKLKLIYRPAVKTFESFEASTPLSVVAPDVHFGKMTRLRGPMQSFKNGLPLIVAVLIAAGGMGYGLRERFRSVELTNREQALTRTLGQLELQMAELTERFNEKAADKPVEIAVVKPRPRRAPVVRVAPERKVDDEELRRAELLYADEAQKLASAAQEVKTTREELEDQLSSAKDELSDSIAKTHEELSALQKKGETNYTEFTLDKFKDFREVGPVSVSLQKVDTKHQRYNLELIVDQVKLEKKNINLYEPVYLTLSDSRQPVVLVVNQITKTEVRGYVSLPKYKNSDLVSEVVVNKGMPESSR